MHRKRARTSTLPHSWTFVVPSEYFSTMHVTLRTSSKNKDKATFYSPVEIQAVPTPISKSTEEREFVVDSGASMHMLSNRDLSADDMKTLRRSRNLRTVVTANVEVQTNEKAQVYVHDLDLFVTVQIFDDTPAGLSLGKLCEEHGYSYESASGQEPRFTEQGKKKYAKQKMSVLLLSQDCRQVPQARAKRLLHRFGRTHQVLLRGQHVSDQEAAGNRLRDLP